VPIGLGSGLGARVYSAANALLFLVAPATAVAGTLMFAEPFTLATGAGFAACAAGVTLVLVSEARSERAAGATASGLPSTAAGEPARAMAPGSAPEAQTYAAAPAGTT